MSEKWYILQYKPNSHLKAAKNLNQQGFETFLPIYEFTTRKSSSFINVKRPLFSGYMFVKFDRSNSEWRKINNTYGVSCLITFNSVLRSVPTSFINNLMYRSDCSGKLLSNKKLKKGDGVKILNGPFTNFVAIVEMLDADQRISVLMDLMGRQTKIVTNLNELKLSN